MTHSTVTRLREQAKRLRALARLDRERRLRGITNGMIAERAGLRGKTLVVHFFAGRAKSARLEQIVRQMIAETQARPSGRRPSVA